MNKATDKSESSGRLIVVSNRLPMTLSRVDGRWTSQRSTGGLATAMDPLLQRMGGIWIGWSGDRTDLKDVERSKVLERWRTEENCIAIDMPPETVRGFYQGFSNETLWFLFHSFPGLTIFRSEDWRQYVRANEMFRDAVVENLQPNDVVWVHDYQLMLLPQLVRETVPNARIGFFLHIPFPPSDIFRVLPRREEVLTGLLGADFIAFHTYQYLQNFRTSVSRILGIRTSMDGLALGGRHIGFAAQPIGIAPNEFIEVLRKPETRSLIADFRERYRGLDVLLGVDRMDLTKGIPERLQAYSRFLQQNRRARGRTVLIQVAVPSREGVSQYRKLQREVDELVGKINGRYGTPEWSPIIYLRRNLSRDELIALYAIADVALVTPLRDGENLVAKEYIACKPDGDGVLILSEFAGASAELGEALMVNPYDADGTARTIGRALNLPKEQKKARMAALYNRVMRNTVFTWSERFLENVCRAAERRRAYAAERPQRLNQSDILAAYRQAENRLILLDYDGTLVGYEDLAKDAVPPRDLVRSLRILSDRIRNTVVLVSGRAAREIEEWLGGVKGLWLAAEHGAVIRDPDTEEWVNIHPMTDLSWKRDVRDLLEEYADRTPGSYVEEKEFSLVWHYRMADPEFGEWLANELTSTLEAMLSDTQLRAVQGRKTVEVKLMWANKADVLAHMTSTPPPFDFILAAGDDTTDEDLFRKMLPEMWTVHIGNERSAARFRLNSFREMRSLIEEFNRADERAQRPRETAAGSIA